MRSAIARWRERLNLNQKEACNRIGCSRPALRSWERGDTTPPLYVLLACAAVEEEVKPIR